MQALLDEFNQNFIGHPCVDAGMKARLLEKVTKEMAHWHGGNELSTLNDLRVHIEEKPDCPAFANLPFVVPVPALNLPNAVYITPLIGNNIACLEQFFTLTDSPTPDEHSTDRKETCGSQVVFGGTIGANVFSFPNPLQMADKTAPRPPDRMLVGFEFTFLDGSDSFTATGTPVTAFPGPGSDKYSVRDLLTILANATATLPVNPSVAIILRAGFGAVEKSITYQCIGYCAAGGFPSFSEKQTEWVFGPDVSGGLLIHPQGSPVVFEANVTHIFAGSRNYMFGMPASVSVGFKANQGDTIATFGASFPISGPRPFSSEQVPQFNFRF